MSTHVCVECGATGAEFTCGFCRIPRYCARLCQKKDHERHKPECYVEVMERRQRRREKEEEGETKSPKEAKKVSVEDQKLYTETLCIGVKEKNLRLIRLLLAKDETNVNEVGTDGWSPLLLACFNGLISVVELLLGAEDIDVNQAKTTDGCTPLFVACQEGHAPVVELLLASSEIDVNEPLMNGATPLIIASYLGQASCVSLLLKDPAIDLALLFQEHTALQLAQPSMRVVDWKFLEEEIKIEGRQNVVQLLLDASALNSADVVAEGETKSSKESKKTKKVSVKQRRKYAEDDF